MVGHDQVYIGFEQRTRSRPMLSVTYVSNGQSGFANVCKMSGRVAASSLYTVQKEAKMLWPPFAEQLRVIRPRQSHTVSVWNGFVRQLAEDND